MNNSNNEFKQVPVVILCGGNGVMLNEKQKQRINKGLVEVQNKPLFLWVMHHYALHGACDFILATGYQSEQFGSALETAGGKANADKLGCYDVMIANMTCSVRIVPTMSNATTAERLLACKPWLEKAVLFATSYSDTLSDVDLNAEMLFHKSQNVVATLASIKFPMRFRILGIRAGESLVRAFALRPVIESVNINGGYYIFTNAIWKDVYGLEKLAPLESQTLENLAAEGQLTAFEHKGRWQNCDAERDLVELRSIAANLDLITSRIIDKKS